MDPKKQKGHIRIRLVAATAGAIDALPVFWFFLGVGSNWLDVKGMLLAAIWLGILCAPFIFISASTMWYAITFQRSRGMLAVLKFANIMHFCLIILALFMFGLRSHPRFLDHADFWHVPAIFLMINLFQLALFSVINASLLRTDPPTLGHP